MNSKIIPLSSTHHQALRVDSSKGYPHAAQLDTSLLQLDEVKDAIADYCIIFNKDAQTGAFKLIALLGLGFGHNVFQNAAGWNATYVPKNISRYPFLLAQDEDNDAVLLCIDEAAPQLNTLKGAALFDDNGDASAFQKQMLDRLQKMMASQQDTQNFISALSSAHLLQAMTLNAKMENGTIHGVEGLYGVNKEALQHLSTGTLENLHAQKYLEPLMLINASTAQLSRLVQLHNAHRPDNLVQTLEIQFSE